MTACSAQKNTAKSRWWHAFNARYNTYYNGTLAYIDGSLAKEEGNLDNYTELLPLYTVGNKNSKSLGKNSFDKAITKCEKAIQLHSIKARPEWNKSRRKTERDREWLSRREYNPFLWKAWMLMGRSQFHSGDFEGAASTFAYMSRLYETQPAIYGKARAWLAKCYVEQDYLYDAEDVIRNMERDSIHWAAQKEWDYAYADYYIHSHQYEKAIPYLRKVIRHEMRRKQRAREWYLMGQLQAALGNRQEAYRAYKRVVRLNPPYQLEFNARIAMTEVLASGNSKQMISRLKRMAASDKNKEYLDQVYYAIGNIHLAQRDTLQAIAAYEKGNAKATRSGIEKGVLLLRLGNLYWDKEKFSDAQRCYGEAIGLLDKERGDYQQLDERSKVLDDLVPHTDAIHLQDSLQALAKMSEADRNAAIDRVIEALKKKEKEERDRLAEAEAEQQLAQNGGTGMVGSASNKQTAQQATTTGSAANGAWYFYNPTAVAQGKMQFQRLWGKRENVDNWQRVNKTVVATDNLADSEKAQASDGSDGSDSSDGSDTSDDSKKKESADPAQDPHKREYYLAQIPFTDEQLTASNQILEDALYHAGVIFKDRLDNLDLGERHLRRLTDHYPDYAHMDDAYYHLYLLYNRKGDAAMGDLYLSKLKTDHPQSQWTTLLTDPYYVENARFGQQMEDSLYTATYNAFKAERHGEVKGNCRVSASRFPKGANREKFLFIGGLSKLNAGDADGCLTDMKAVVEQYPEGRIAEMAGMIVKGVSAGRRLRGGRFDLDEVWSRRNAVMADSDSIQRQTFSAEPEGAHVFMLVYHPDSLNENQLLYEVAKFNFTTYLVRNFDIEIDDIDGLHRMRLSGFRSYAEVSQYACVLSQQQAVARVLDGKARQIVISEANLPLLGTTYSYKDYEVYYQKSIAPVPVTTRPLLTEPADIAIPEPDPVPVPMPDPVPVPMPESVPVPMPESQPSAPASDDGDIIIEENGQPASDSDNGDLDLDDEYYDLDGF